MVFTLYYMLVISSFCSLEVYLCECASHVCVLRALEILNSNVFRHITMVYAECFEHVSLLKNVYYMM